jgi:hypothetical protein
MTRRNGSRVMGNSQIRRCFVISPIGAERSSIREHADDVYDYIIKPAMDACDIEAFRSDHLREPGRISDQMFRELLKDDLCIALLNDHNPNVFYELAIAQAAARPVIILVHKGQSLPFDIQDLRCVYYDLKPRMLFDRTYVNEIIAHVRAVEALNWKVGVPFGIHPPLGGGGEVSHEPQFFERAVDYGDLNRWMTHVQETQQVLDLTGATLSFWRTKVGASDLIIQKANAGCRVRILLMHRDNPVLPHLINEVALEMNVENKAFVLDQMFRFFSKMAEQSSNIKIRLMKRGCPHFQLTRTDTVALMVQYLFSEKLRESPMWKCVVDSSLYDRLAKDFEALWQANGEG